MKERSKTDRWGCEEEVRKHIEWKEPLEKCVDGIKVNVKEGMG